MSAYIEIQEELYKYPRTWLITGAAGFIGSNIVEKLIELGQTVIGLDNFSNGYKRNVEEINKGLTPFQANNFKFIEGDIRDLDTCMACCRDVDIVLNQAALGSVPRSINDPIASNQSNVDGFLNILIAARDSKVERLVYTSSSSVYGDSPELPKIESRIGNPLSPYAVTKYVNELYAKVFCDIYGVPTIGLRYFNVFGPRQDPDGAYAAVIPSWFAALLKGAPAHIYGDGETSRDFCYIANVVQANLLAACTDNIEAVGQTFNVAYSQLTTLNELFFIIRDIVAEVKPEAAEVLPAYREFRPGDIRHSLADIGKAASLLGYSPTHSVKAGLREAAGWYIDFLK